MSRKITYLLILLGLTSCGAQRNLVYFSDLKGSTVYKIPGQSNIEPAVQQNDLLGITVSSLSAESNNFFNNAVLPAAGNITTGIELSAKSNEGYLVDKNGFINFPALGKIKLAGLTREQVTDKLTGILAENYIKSPIVNVRFLNFKVTVIGEVNRPSTFVVSTERINVLEALGLAGDMTGFGKRENVLVIREKDGERTMTRINLNNKEVLSSPYFYLQQNDIVYVEPDKARALQVSKRNVNLPIYLSIASIFAIVLTRININ
ncbi:polysaccharide biosynthesis/export family protein [Spirosoma humi]